VELEDCAKYYGRIDSPQNWGQFCYGDPLHLPPDTTIGYRLYSKGPSGRTIYSNRVPVSGGFTKGEHRWELEYATVLFVFEGHTPGCEHKTVIENWGNVPDGGVAHLPPDTNVKHWPMICNCPGTKESKQYPAGDSTKIWVAYPCP